MSSSSSTVTREELEILLHDAICTVGGGGGGKDSGKATYNCDENDYEEHDDGGAARKDWMTSEGCHDESMKRKRAVVIRTAGVPDLIRILIQIENAVIEVSVAKHSVALCSWEELELHPYQQRPLQQAVNHSN